ncbi:hypothetical protein AA0488_1624 [Kozakia baliensis NRIC 0488]|nr:hypothetical protein AA0488_1624 [Kozakia baliensis NRIC 0488]
MCRRRFHMRFAEMLDEFAPHERQISLDFALFLLHMRLRRLQTHHFLL